VALKEAQKKLGERGVYILGDITNLPLADDSIDGVVSLHTIYHVPAAEQARAFRELGRVLAPGRSGVVVYSWGNHTLVPFVARLPAQPLIHGLRLLSKLRGATNELYFAAHSPRWFASQSWPFRYRILVWRSLPVPLMRAVVHGPPGRLFLRSLEAVEERWPELLGRVGQYPLIVMEK